MTTDPLAPLRREAKRLERAYARGEPDAAQLMAGVAREGAPRHADFLHVTARQHGFASWPALKAAVALEGLERAQALLTLRRAYFLGQQDVADRVMAAHPDIPARSFGALCAGLDTDGVAAWIARDPAVVLREEGPRRPLLHLCFSRAHRWVPGGAQASVEIAQALLEEGADVNDSAPAAPDDPAPLSALYAALCHADNPALAAFLLTQGADPNDGESLYHATELGRIDGVRLLLAHGARPGGTNALLRALDFNAHDMVDALLAAGADPNEGPIHLPGTRETALHHAARRGCDRQMGELLLRHGAADRANADGIMPHTLAVIYGTLDLARVLTPDPAPSPGARQLMQAAQGEVASFIDPAQLPIPAGDLVAELLHLGGRLDHIRRLIAAGLPWDAPDGQGLTPVQTAGWLGDVEAMAYFLGQRPDLSHVNGYGGTLLSTILHGADMAPRRDGQDHVACAELALIEGVSLPARAERSLCHAELTRFLMDWAAMHPGQVVEHGVT
ncbi:MAG: ankyrin repeat domain-containing protein [Shimia sp.]